MVGETVSEGDGAVDFMITLSPAAAAATSFDAATSDGTAAAGSDYGSVSRRVTIPAGATSAVVSVTVIDDAVVESDEVFALTLSNPSTNANLGSMPSATATINDDDIQPLSPMTTLTAVTAVTAAPHIISDLTGAADICAKNHINGEYGRIVWDYDQRQADLNAWTSANGHACCPTAVWHPYHDSTTPGDMFWSDAEADWWPELDRWETERRTHNAAVATHNTQISAYNAAVHAYNIAAAAYNSGHGSPPTFTGVHPGPAPTGHPGPAPKFTDSDVYRNYANKDQGPVGCYPALPS